MTAQANFDPSLDFKKTNVFGDLYETNAGKMCKRWKLEEYNGQG